MGSRVRLGVDIHIRINISFMGVWNISKFELISLISDDHIDKRAPWLHNCMVTNALSDYDL